MIRAALTLLTLQLAAFAQPSGSSTVQSYKAAGDGAAPRSVADVLAETLSVKDFGACGNGTCDDTAAWTKAIAKAIATHATLSCPAGTYKVVKQGTASIPWFSGTARYVFLITSPLTIRAAERGTCTISSSVLDADNPNVFLAQSTHDVTIEGLNFVGTGTPATAQLYSGAAIAFDRCNHCWSKNNSASEMRYNTEAFDSIDSGVDGGFSAMTSGRHTGSHFVLYSGHHQAIRHTISYGAAGDGNVFCFGSGSDNEISDNKTYNYDYGDSTKTIVANEAQGFGLDSGQTLGKLINNYAYGFYFCADLKHGSTGNLMAGNTVEKCKVGVSARLGESGSPNWNNTIANNIIRPSGGNGNTDTSFFGGLTPTVGIFVQDSYGTTIDGNVVEASPVGFPSAPPNAQDFIGFYGVTTFGSFLSYETAEGLTITNNRFNQLVTMGSGYAYSTNSVMVIAGNSTNPIPRLTISGNTFRPSTGITTPTLSLSKVNNASVAGNDFAFAFGAYVIQCATCNIVTVATNTFEGLVGALTVSNSTGLSVTGNVFGEQFRLSGSPIPLIYSDTSSKWSITGNVHNHSGSVNNGRFFETSATGNSDITITGNTLYPGIFIKDWFCINDVCGNGTTAPNTPAPFVQIGANSVLARPGKWHLSIDRPSQGDPAYIQYATNGVDYWRVGNLGVDGSNYLDFFNATTGHYSMRLGTDDAMYVPSVAQAPGVASPLCAYSSPGQLIACTDRTAIDSFLTDVGTPGTYTQVTTDAKGRVTAGATAASTNLSDSANLVRVNTTPRLSGIEMADAALASGVAVTWNAYWDSGASAWKYRANGYALAMVELAGLPFFYTGGSGTAGGAVTWTQTGVTPAGGAGGDLTGSFPNPGVGKLQGRTVSAAAPVDKSVLAYLTGSSQWQPYTITAADVAAVAIGAACGGDLSGTFPNCGVAKLQGRTVSSAAPGDKAVLAYLVGASQWQPYTITAADIGALALATTFGGDVTGAYNALNVGKIQGVPWQSGVPTNLDVPFYDGVNARWSRTPMASIGAVTSVAGRTGAVTLGPSDVGLGNLTNEKQAPVKNTVSLLNQSGASSGQLLAMPTAALYLASVYLKTTTTGGGTAAFSVIWNDGVGSRTVQLTSIGLNSTATAIGENTGLALTWMDGAHDLSYSITTSGITGSPRFEVRVSAVRIW